MPLWKIAWRSIQRRSLASLLTMFSMALGVMLVVAVLLIVGVVDQSFQSNSSLGYDTIVGAKGGSLQLTLNTVYYLSQPVENLPYEFYQEFLPAESKSRDEKPTDAHVSVHFRNEIEFEKDGEWIKADGPITIPAGEMYVRLRVPVLEREANESTNDESTTGENESAPELGEVFRLEVQEAGTAKSGEALEGLLKRFESPKELEIENDGKWRPLAAGLELKKEATSVEIRYPQARRFSSDKKFKLRLERVSEENLNEFSASAIATLLANRDDTVKEETLPMPPEPIAGVKQEPAKRTTLKVNSVSVQPDEPHAYFVARIYHLLKTDVKFTAKLIDGSDGEFVPFLAPDKVSAIPVSLGDYLGQFRVIGTTSEFFEMVYDRENLRTYEFAEGGNFTGAGSHGVFEAIVGAKVARERGYSIGDLMQPSHGSPEGEAHDDFEIVGILKSSGTPQDRGVFVNIKGFNQIPQHIREDGSKEVTSLLVDTKDPLQSRALVFELSEAPVGQAVKPVQIIYGLFSRIVGPIRNLLLVITLLICVVSGIGILVSIYNSMSDRKKEIAVMRALGAGRSTVMSVVLLESVMISMIGGLIGWLAGHGLIGLASGKIESETGVVVSALDLAPPMKELSYLLGEQLTPNISVEIWLIPLLIVLAIAVGFLPAWTAYRTDVAEALQSSP